MTPGVGVSGRCVKEFMRCPYCREDKDKVIDSRSADDGCAVRRRRECLACGKRFTTYEQFDQKARLWVIKKDGTRVPYDPQKVLEGLQKACYKRPVSTQVMSQMADQVHELLLKQGRREVDAVEIGQAIAERLKRVDQVAYVRFASVYKRFRDIDDLLEEVREVIESSPDEDGPDQGTLF